MKIIINADDFGFTKATNEAVFELAKLGTLTSTTVMTNMPYAGEAAKLLEHPNFSSGLHFNLTQGRPVSPAGKVPSLVDEDGSFYSLKELSLRAKQGKLSASEVVAELEAQFDALYGIVGDRISHMDSHQGLNRIPFIFSCTVAFLKKRPIKAARFYIKHYAVGSGATARVELPGLRTVRKYGIKRLLVEGYLKQKRGKLRKVTSCPDGMLMARNHDTMDVFKWISENDPSSIKLNKIVEVPCHPAANTNELVDTKYVEERVGEYRFLKSDAFVDASRRWSFVDYSSVYR